MRIVSFFSFLVLYTLTGYTQQKHISYSVADISWNEQFGNHRAVVEITKPTKAVKIDFLWRRHDLHPESRQMQIVHAASGEVIKNIYRVQINQERCELIFGPVEKTGTYYFYYLPYTPETKEYFAPPYLAAEKAPDPDWVTSQVWKTDSLHLQQVPIASVKEIQARAGFHSFYPMEVVATQRETDSLFTLYQHKEFLVFPEDRTLPIRMLDAIPYRWTQQNPGLAFKGTAQKNEYYAFQLGVVAGVKRINNIKPLFSDLKTADGNTIRASAFTCFNTEGVDTKGAPFSKTVNIAKAGVQPLWMGIDIAPDTRAGVYKGSVTLQAANATSQVIPLEITVGDSLLTDRGDGETWRHSRLRWLNSTLGIDDNPTKAYQSLSVSGTTIEATNKKVQLDASGLPTNISTTEGNILYAPVKFTIEMNNKISVFTSTDFSFQEKKAGVVSWKSTLDNDKLRLVCKGEMEFDGRLSYTYTVEAKEDIHVQDIRLELPLKKAYATYMMGMGRMGGFTPANHISRWQKTEDSFWIGETSGGIQCELRGGSYHGPLLNLYQPNPPASWFNGVNGGFRIDSDQHQVIASAYSGARHMKKGQKVDYQFALLITPVKPLDMKAQFTNRYEHSPYPREEVIANGGNVMNIHHANKYNPYINYPFIAQKEMKDIVSKWHDKGWKVKIYYTVRELTNHLTEIWALRSLGNEVLAGGRGGGYQWLQEHLVTGYTPQWYTHIGDGVVDAAILNGSESRWYNYYIEGLHWLVKNMDIDGLYLDDVSFDRNIVKRMRKVMEMTKPDCMIDLHSNTAFSLGSANQNLEMFPFIDKIWFGEGFNFDLMPPDFWLTEVSGIPFGVPNDILMHMSVNNKRGMTYGMTHRGYSQMWKLWDEFGIADAKMHGYWEKNPVTKTGNPNVQATTFVKDGQILIALGNWSNHVENITLDVNWKALGLNAKKLTIVAPDIKDYQKQQTFRITDKITVDAKDDLILIVKGQ